MSESRERSWKYSILEHSKVLYKRILNQKYLILVFLQFRYIKKLIFTVELLVSHRLSTLTLFSNISAQESVGNRSASMMFYNKI